MKKYILGLNFLTNSSCAIMLDGEIVYVGQEERFKRFKNISGFPHKALKYGFNKLKITGTDIQKVGFSTISFDPLLIKSSVMQNYKIRDFYDYYGDRYWRKIFSGQDCTDYLRWLKDDKQFNSHEVDFDYSFITEDVLSDTNQRIALFRKYLKKHLYDHFGIAENKVAFLDHHTCHAYYGYFGSPLRNNDCAVVTLDGIGDGRNQTVFSVKNNQLDLVASSNENDLGRVYKMATLINGMRPEEHEFKVMGMAPYAKESYAEEAFLPLKELSKVENMKILHNKRPKDLFAYLRDAWLDKRFDNICGAAQLFVERIATELFKDINATLNVRKFLISGGISMNIKMNKVLSELNCVDEIYVCGSGGDESLCIGACYFLNADNENNQPLSHLYLGYDIKDDLANDSWKTLCEDYEIQYNVSEEQVAALIANGNIIARVHGRSEFGARALGNRSILADPRNIDVIKQINDAIKKRDFWMPFALSVLEEDHEYCVENPKKLKAPFMSIGFQSNGTNYNKFRAGTHPYDQTVRPQFVSKQYSESYHKLISSFKRITGVPALLNTSLNLHGEPIANNLEDVIRTFSNSEISHLYLNDVLIVKQTSLYR